MDKVVRLERVNDTFGFSVFGGARTTLPPVVCEVTPGGPADLCGQMRVGDVIKEINSVSLENKKPDEVVQIIRSAPKSSAFRLLEDEHYREKTLEYLRKRERKAVKMKRRKRASVESSTSTASDISFETSSRSGEERGHSETPSITEAFSRVEEDVSMSSERRRDNSSSEELPRRQTGSVQEAKASPQPTPQRSSFTTIIQKSNSFTSVRHHSTKLGSPSRVRDSNGVERRRSLESSGVFQIQIQNGNIVTSDKDGGKLPHWNIAPEGHPRRHSSECSSHRNAHSTDDICRTSTSNRDTSPQCGERGKEEGENRAASSEVEVVNTSSESDLDRVHSSSESTLQSSTATSIPDELSLGDRRGDSPLVDGGLTPVVEDDGRDTPLVDGGITPLADDGRRDTPLAEDGLTPLVEERGLGHLISDSGGESPKGHPPLKATKCIGENPEDVDPTLSSEGNEGTLKKESVISASGIFLSFSTSPDMQNSLGDIAEVHEEDNPAVLLRSDQRHSHSDSPGDRELPKQRSLSSGTVLDESMAAADLARKLYTLDGIKKEAVAKHLSIKSNFGSIVAKEYVEHFNFEGATLDEALRTFLSSFALVGESQEIDRIMNHFSQRYFEENPWSFPSKDTIHAVVSAMLLLNSDLHKEHGNAKMTSSQFVSNIMQLEVEFPQNKKDFHKFLRTLYDSIKRDPIKFISDSDDTLSERGISPASEPDHTTPPSGVRMYKVNVPGSFVEVELPGDSPVFKEGQVMRKNVMEGPHKKVPRGHRGWKGYHAYLKGFLLYFSEPHSELRLEDTRNALPIMNCLATNAHDYSKKSAVLRVTTSDWHVFLLQASNMLEVQQWITAINRSAATYSSPPLAAAVGSGTITKFVRPMFPLRPTANNLEEQGKSHLDMIASLEKELEEHRKIKPSGKGTGGRTADWFDKYEYLQYEISRYRIYHVSLTSDVDISQLNAPLPSMLMPSPSTLTLATANADTWSRYRSPPSPTPSSSSYRGSPLLRRKQYYNKN